MSESPTAGRELRKCSEDQGDNPLPSDTTGTPNTHPDAEAGGLTFQN